MDTNSTSKILTDLSKPLLIAAALIGISIALFSSSFMYFDQLMRQHESTQEAYRTIKKGVLVTKGEIEIARKYSLAFQSLSESNATGDFAKQRALDHLEQALSENLVVPKSYSLAARKILTSSDFAGLDKHEVAKHTVTMEMQLPHEIRLLTLIEKMIAPNPGGITTVEACEITTGKHEGKESTSITASSPASVPLSSRCQLSWYRFGAKAIASSNGLSVLNNPPLPNIPDTPLTAATFGSPPGKK
jgi:type II secretory pathway pseudopilin PulG